MPTSKMLEEIRQQPKALENTLRHELASANALRARLQRNKPKLIVLVARGTSDNAAQFGRYLLEITTGIQTSLAAPSIFTLYHTSVDFSNTLLVAISQSGESTDTNLVLQQARQAGALTVGITNEAGSAMAKLCEHLFLVRAGKEKSVAATKTYTGQLLMIYLLAYALGAPIKIEDLRRLPEWTSQALKLEKDIAERAERFRFMDHAVVVGRGLNYSNAFEFALKLMETCYVVAERFSSADLLHGPIAMVEPELPVFLFAPGGVTWSGQHSLMQRLWQAKAEVTVITDQSNPLALKALDGHKLSHCISVPAKLTQKGRAPVELYTPIPYIVPAQLLAASLAEIKGLDPDRPRSLNKVTRTL